VKIKSLLQLLLAFITLAMLSVSAQAANSIVTVTVDTKDVGRFASMVVNSQGFPVISYYSSEEATLKIGYCADANCTTFSSVITPDTATQVGQYTSITLDSSGAPIVSYYDIANADLKVLHCGNASCSANNTITTPDASGTVGQNTSVTVDAKNFPVVSYYDATKGLLKVLHCGDAACKNNNVTFTPDSTGSNGLQSSIKLSAAGNPIVAYYDITNHALKVLNCGNANCNASNTIVTADASNDVGTYPAMVLDSSGNPAVSYFDITNGRLKILRCGNTTCGSGNTVTTPVATNGVSGYFSSIVLPTTGFPVVSYFNRSTNSLNILQCGNAACNSGNNSLTVPDSGNVGEYTTLALDAKGYPLVSYYDYGHNALKVLHCDSVTCSDNSDVVADSATGAGQFTSMKLDSNGNAVVSYWDSTKGSLKLLHCGNANCSANNNIATPSSGNTGADTALALDANGFPVISYYDLTANLMKVMHCGNANCTSTNTIKQPDPMSMGHTAIALDSAGYPVIASAGESSQSIRIVHCGDATCAANNVASSPDLPASPFQADVRGVSMVLDASGNPVASFYRADNGQLKLLHCINANCSGTSNSIVVLDPGAQPSDPDSTSVILDAAGSPVIAYQDMAHKKLKVLHCGNANCTSGNTIAVIAAKPRVGFQPSIQLDSNGNPVVSYGAPTGLNVIHCGNTTCTANNTSIITDAAAPTGWFTSLALDASGKPLVSYYNGTNLKVLHCDNANCN
jgi:hypothetical protein